MVHPGTVDREVMGLVNFGKSKVKKIALSGNAAGTIEYANWHTPLHCAILDVFVHIKTAVAGKTIDIGTKAADESTTYGGDTTGDVDGFVNDLSLAATGIIRPNMAISATGGVHFESTTRGVYLTDFAAGSAAADRGICNDKPCLIQSGKTICWTPGSLTTALVADLYIVYVELGSWSN
jgi:hypothetical protein